MIPCTLRQKSLSVDTCFEIKSFQTVQVHFQKNLIAVLIRSRNSVLDVHGHGTNEAIYSGRRMISRTEKTATAVMNQ